MCRPVLPRIRGLHAFPYVQEMEGSPLAAVGSADVGPISRNGSYLGSDRSEHRSWLSGTRAEWGVTASGCCRPPATLLRVARETSRLWGSPGGVFPEFVRRIPRQQRRATMQLFRQAVRHDADHVMLSCCAPQPSLKPLHASGGVYRYQSFAGRRLVLLFLAKQKELSDSVVLDTRPRVPARAPVRGSMALRFRGKSVPCAHARVMAQVGHQLVDCL